MHSSLTEWRIGRAAADAGFCTRCGSEHLGVGVGILAAVCFQCKTHTVWHRDQLISYFIDMLTGENGWGANRLRELLREHALRHADCDVPHRPQLATPD